MRDFFQPRNIKKKTSGQIESIIFRLFWQFKKSKDKCEKLTKRNSNYSLTLRDEIRVSERDQFQFEQAQQLSSKCENLGNTRPLFQAK